MLSIEDGTSNGLPICYATSAYSRAQYQLHYLFKFVLLFYMVYVKFVVGNQRAALKLPKSLLVVIGVRYLLHKEPASAQRKPLRGV